MVIGEHSHSWSLGHRLGYAGPPLVWLLCLVPCSASSHYIVVNSTLLYFFACTEMWFSVSVSMHAHAHRHMALLELWDPPPIIDRVPDYQYRLHVLRCSCCVCSTDGTKPLCICATAAAAEPARIIGVYVPISSNQSSNHVCPVAQVTINETAINIVFIIRQAVILSSYMAILVSE